MKLRSLFLTATLLLFAAPAGSVLKEKDLARTLGVLKAELQATYEMQQAYMQSYEQKGMQQHKQLIWYMQQCEQIGLMLYSQSTENTFDMAYACQQAANLKRDLDNRNSKMRQYDKFIALLKQEIERTDHLIRSLKRMPPVIDADSILSSSDSILLQAIDSLGGKKDSLLIARESMDEEAINIMEEENQEIPEEEEENLEPLYLTRALRKDRDACLLFADTIRSNTLRFLESLEAENAYYQSVRDKVAELDKYAQSRYRLLQENIFRNGSSNYFSILANLSKQIMMVKSSINMKYKPLKGHEWLYSEWRDATVIFICISPLLLALSICLCYVLLRLLLPKKWRGADHKYKRLMLNNAVGIALFAVIVMLVRAFEQRNFIQMGTGLIINFAWLLEAIFLSLYVRLKGEQMRHAAVIYTPLMMLAFIVILFRIVLIPNSLVNLIFPPVLLVFAIWQYIVARRHRKFLPLLDKVYTNITTVATIFACVAAWAGYTLLAVQIMIWWTFQLAAIMTITCIYDLTKKFEMLYLLQRIGNASGRRKLSNSKLQASMKKGEYIEQTWLYDFFHRTIVPILAVLSVLVSIYWAAEVFEMTSLCEKVFMRDIVNQTGIIRISLFWVCMAAALFFIFRYINYALRSFYLHYRKQFSDDNTAINKTLARNVFGILCWGLYIIIVLIIFKVPKDGISIVGAGLATGLGFAMQSILENFFYGISLMTGRIHVGDYIECDGIAGRVESITYQSTQITTIDGGVIAFLNSALFKKNFKNMTRNHRYEFIKIPIGVAYGTDVEQVRKLLVEAITPVCQEVNAAGQPLTDTNIPVSIAFSDFGDSSVDLKVGVWMLVEEKFALTARIKEVIYNTLNKNGIEIPFPQRDVHIINNS